MEEKKTRLESTIDVESDDDALDVGIDLSTLPEVQRERDVCSCVHLNVRERGCRLMKELCSFEFTTFLAQRQ